VNGIKTVHSRVMQEPFMKTAKVGNMPEILTGSLSERRMSALGFSNRHIEKHSAPFRVMRAFSGVFRLL